MSKILAIASRNASYVYHMLSVAGVGYDNTYGEKYRHLHAIDDLHELQHHKDMLTVKGGVHIGQLYGLLVAAPAALDDDIIVDEYYAYLEQLFETHDVLGAMAVFQPMLAQIKERKVWGSLDIKRPDLDRYIAFREEILAIIKVMRRNYAIFMQAAWPEEEERLVKYLVELNQALDEVNVVSRWEEFTGYTYEKEYFYAVICTSLLNGPQAIDIAEDKDIFQLSPVIPPLRDFIYHEFGIYVLLHQLDEFLDSDTFSHWKPLESLAGYFNQLVLQKEVTGWRGDVQLIRFYEELRHGQPSLSVREMFLAARDYQLGKGK